MRVFLSFRNDASGVEALNWWRDRCIEWCYARREDGKYGDQLYLNDWPARFKRVVVLQNIGAGVAPWNHIQYDFNMGSKDSQVLVNDTPLVFYHFHSIAFVGPQVVIPTKYVSNPVRKGVLRLCFIPYLNKLQDVLEKVRIVLPDFDFGIKHEAAIDYKHTFLARGEMRPQLEGSAVSQFRIPLDKDWDCYCSNQLIELSRCSDEINDLINAGETAKALSVVKGALTEFPDAPPLLAFQAELKYEGKEREKALEKVLEFHPNCARAHSSLGLLYQSGGNNEKAQYHYEKAARLEPGNIISQKTLADFYYVVSERTSDALRFYSRIFRLNPNDTVNLLMLGHISVSLRKFDEATAIYNRILELEPWNVDARKKLDVLGRRGQKTEGGGRRTEDGGRRTDGGGQRIEFHADERSVESVEELYQNAQGLIRSNRKKDAVSVLKKLVSSYSDHALAHNDLGGLYSDKGEKEKALLHYKKAAALEPDNPIFQKTLADFYYAILGQVEDALVHYARTLSNDPTNIDTLFMLGHISVSKEKFDEAKVFYNNVLEIEPSNAVARENLGLLAKREKVDDEDETALND